MSRVSVAAMRPTCCLPVPGCPSAPPWEAPTVLGGGAVWALPCPAPHRLEGAVELRGCWAGFLLPGAHPGGSPEPRLPEPFNPGVRTPTHLAESRVLPPILLLLGVLVL